MQPYVIKFSGIQLHFFPPVTIDKNKIASAHSTNHNHSFIEILFVDSGSCNFKTSDNVYPLHAGEFCMISPKIIHSLRPGKENAVYFSVTLECIDPSAPLAKWFLFQIEKHPVWIGAATTISPILKEIYKESSGGNMFSQEALPSLAKLFLVYLSRTSLESAPTAVPETKKDTQNVQIDLFMNNHFALATGKDTLSKELNTSSRQLGRILKKQYGMSFREKRSQVRLVAACDLLKNSQMTVAEIAAELGYSTPSNFTAFFKKMQGITPSEYRTIENRT